MSQTTTYELITDRTGQNAETSFTGENLVYLHYVGKNYGAADFIAEAEKMGVSRAIPKHNATKMAGKTVLLATFEGSAKEPGTATIIGWMRVTGFNICMEPEIVKEMGWKMIPVETEEVRKCGRYKIITMMPVPVENLKILTDAADRVMMTGKFYPFEKPVVMENMTFCRGLAAVNIMEMNRSIIPEMLKVNICTEYNRNF